MSLREEIENAMSENYNSRLTNIADLVGEKEEDVRKRMSSLDFATYVDLMRALRDWNAETARDILGFGMNEYNTGGTMSPSEMRAARTGQTQAPQAQGQGAGQSQAKRAQSMQRLGKKNLGGATAAQAADALDKAGQGKPLTPIQRKAMAQQAASVDALAQDPKTATQFRNLLNKINNK